jgi:hypothetical protein
VGRNAATYEPGSPSTAAKVSSFLAAAPPTILDLQTLIQAFHGFAALHFLTFTRLRHPPSKNWTFRNAPFN